MIKHLIAISAVLLSAISLVFLLSWISLESFNKKNGFERKNGISELSIISQVKNENGLIDIVDFNSESIFFKTKNPNELILTDLDLKGQKILSVTVPDDRRIRSNFDFVIDSTGINVLAGNIPAMIVTNPEKVPVMTKFPGSSYTRVARISSSSFIFRGFDSTVKTPDQIFFKANYINNSVQREKNLSEMKHDAGFSTDGLLNYDKELNLLTYVFFYKNQFIVMDTNLNLLHNANTIDTFYNSQIKAENVASKNLFTDMSPKRFINGSSCIAKGHLFIHSSVKADNETSSLFNSKAVVDVYDLKDNKYKLSFYIPSERGNRMLQFKVIRNEVKVLYRDRIVNYRLPEL